MKTVCGHFNGKTVILDENPGIAAPVEVVIVFPEPDPWQIILNDSSPRLALSHLVG